MKPRLFNTVLLSAVMVMGIFMTLAPLSVLAGPLALPPRPPLPSGGDGGGDSDWQVETNIELRMPGAPAGAWTVVQWQDSDGGWHDVEGWCGMLDSGGMKRWWVAPKDSGTGPFRWVVTGQPGGAQLAVSDPFTLPAGPNQTLWVDLSVAE